MTDKNNEAAPEETTPEDANPEVVKADDIAEGDSKDTNTTEENLTPSLQQEEATIKKKYGGLLPKKPPLISKDHEHAFFDSADWALGKTGAHKSKGPLEALRPKLEPTPHHQVRSRSAYAPADGEDSCESNNVKPTDNDDITLVNGTPSSTATTENQEDQRDSI